MGKGQWTREIARSLEKVSALPFISALNLNPADIDKK